MYPVSMIVIFHVLFYPSSTNGQGAALSFDASVYGGTNGYYAHIGESVTLICTVPTYKVAYMYKGSIFSTYEILVKGGKPVEEVTKQKDKYSFQSNGGSYNLTIHNLSKDDSSHYRCFSCTPTGYWCSWPEVVYLDVKETTDKSQAPDFCELVNNTDGIFFTGNNLILRCPKLSLTFETSNGNFDFSGDFEMDDHGNIFRLLTVTDLTPDFNGTMVSCFSDQDDSVGKDFCRYVPTILVFHKITITISGGEREVINGENVTFTCHSQPFLPFSIQWNILDNGVRFDNFSVSEISHGSRIVFSNVEFLDSLSSSLTVSCNVTIGPENNFEMTSVYPRMQHVSTTHETSLPSKISTTHVIAGTTMSISGSDRSISVVCIIVPVLVVGILVIIILGLVYIKLRKPLKSNEDPQNMYTKKGVVNVTENAYDTRRNQKTELGLTNNDSEVVDNVAYVSYDEDYKQD